MQGTPVADNRQPVGDNRDVVVLDAGFLQTMGIVFTMLVGAFGLGAYVRSSNRELRKDLEASFSARFDAVDKRFEDFESKTAARFDMVDRRFDGVDKRLDGVDKRLDGLDKRLDGLDGRLRDVEVEVARHSGLLERIVYSTEQRGGSPLATAR